MVVTATTGRVACNPATSYLEVGYQNSAGSVEVGANNLSSCNHLSSSTRKGACLITVLGPEKENMLGNVYLFFYSLGDQLIIHYYDLGYSYNEILAALLGAHGICIR